MKIAVAGSEGRMMASAGLRFWAVSPMTKTMRVKASPRLVLAYRYLGLGPCQTAGESATRSWVRRVVQPPQKHTRNGISEPRFPPDDVHC